VLLIFLSFSSCTWIRYSLDSILRSSS